MKNIHGYLFLLVCLVSACNSSTGIEQTEKSQSIDPVNPLPDNAYYITSKDTSYLEKLFESYKLVNIKTLDTSIQVQLAYSDTVNFLKKNMYHGLRNAYFNCETAIKIANAQHFLKLHAKNYSLLILDAARPQHIQQLMWDSLAMDSYYKHCYLSPPYEKSLHNYGCAVDVTILDTDKDSIIEMGTPFDFFGKKSQPVFEAYYFKTGELSANALMNRKLLRQVMTRAGMKPINSEWWHFASVTKEEAAKNYELIK